MKPLEWVLRLGLPCLFLGGFELAERNGNQILGYSMVWGSVAIFCGYIYFFKIRPRGNTRPRFNETLELNGFAPTEDENWKAQAKSSLSRFPGFDKPGIFVQGLHEGRIGSIGVLAGEYGMGGRDLNFGFFILVSLPAKSGCPAPGFTKSIDGGDLETAGGSPIDSATSLPVSPQVRKVVEEFPFDLHWRGREVLADFDARHVTPERLDAAVLAFLGMFYEMDTSETAQSF